MSDVTRRAAQFSRARREWRKTKEVQQTRMKTATEEDASNVSAVQRSSSSRIEHAQEKETAYTLSDLRRIYQQRAIRQTNDIMSSHKEKALEIPTKLDRTESWELLDTMEEKNEDEVSRDDANVFEIRLFLRYMRFLEQQPNDLFTLGRIDVLLETIGKKLRDSEEGDHDTFDSALHKFPKVVEALSPGLKSTINCEPLRYILGRLGEK